MKKFILIMIFILSINVVNVFAAENPVEEIPTGEIEENKDLGFFENVFVGFFEFVTSEEFTKLATSVSALMLAIYPFIKKYLSVKAQAKYNSLVDNLENYKSKADEYEKLVLKYAKIADNSIKQVDAIRESLILGFDKSNLRQDVKEKIIATLNSVPQLELPSLDDKGLVIEHESIITNEEKDNLLTEAIEDTNKVSTGW